MRKRSLLPAMFPERIVPTTGKSTSTCCLRKFGNIRKTVAGKSMY